jgi:choline dehydrogenase-like flavoprotein
MIIDARSLEGERLADADILIIGAGAAGLAMALSLDGTSTRVVILESGGETYERESQALYRGRSVGLRYEPLDLCRVRILGGSTDKRGWAGWCKIFDEQDFAARDWVALSGWPIRKADLDPYYAKALETVWLPKDLASRAAADARKPDCFPFADGVCVNDPIPLSTAPQLAGIWRDKLRSSKNVTIVLHANVTQVGLSPDGSMVGDVTFRSLEGGPGRAATARGRDVVLATGGIENARLLLAWNALHGTRLGAGFDWVGRCFMDHPRLAWGQITGLADPSLLTRYNPTHGAGQRREGVPPPGAEPLFGAGIALSPEVQARDAILGSRTWILPVSPQGERPGGRELREMVLWATRKRVPEDVWLRVGAVLRDLPNAASAVVAHLSSIANLSKRWQFLTILEPEPNRDSRVLLDDAVDPLGLPRVKLDWRLTPLAARTLERTQARIVGSLKALGVSCDIVGPGGPRANQTVDAPRWVWHHMGTTRMSEDPATGYVDRNLRAHGMENFYVVGSSVFPTCSTDMPTLSVIALAHRLAEHLEAKARPTARERPSVAATA